MLQQTYRPGRVGISFELFPPKTDEGVDQLMEQVGRLMEFAPDYLTCTYGAGGSTRDKTLDIVTRLKKEFRVPVASHLTIVGTTVDGLRDYLGTARDRGVDAIVALRGDPPKSDPHFRPVDGGFRYANELVSLIAAEFSSFGVAVAAYPETHREATSTDDDLRNLKTKVDAGADVVITQLFYDNADFFEFRERYDAAGIKAPLVPGILPVTSLAQINRIASLCGAKLPAAFCERLAAAEGDEERQAAIGIEFATQQVQELLDSDVPGVHFYVLNRSHATSEILRNLDLRATQPLQ
jgi:methylenetetrahydrofolate reductase (NADPH)